MSRLRKNEREALAAILEEGADTPETLAQIVADKLDELRGARRHHYACLIVAGIPVAVGPYSTRNQAQKVVTKLHADKAWVVGGWTPEGFTAHLDNLDAEVEAFKLNAKEAASREKQFWGRVSRIRENEATAITGKVEIRTLVKKGAWG